MREKDKTYLEEFDKESHYSNSPVTAWGKARRASRVKDIWWHGIRFCNHFRHYYASAFRQNFDDAVIRDIDLERGACASNDLAPGLIRTHWGFRCSAWTPNGYEKREFMTEEAAREWLAKMKDMYKDHCYDVY